MVQREVNPYESPVATEAAQSTSSPVVRAVIRLFAMGLIGFVAFLSVALSYVAVAELFQLEIFPSIGWALGVGAIGAAIFLSSELLNRGKGQKAGFLSRFIVTLVAYVLSAIISSAITSALGWNPPRYRSEQSDPYWIHSLLTFGGILIGALFAVRLLWIGEQRAAEPGSNAR
jgi:hypothetical protein